MVIGNNLDLYTYSLSSGKDSGTLCNEGISCLILKNKILNSKILFFFKSLIWNSDVQKSPAMLSVKAGDEVRVGRVWSAQVAPHLCATP